MAFLKCLIQSVHLIRYGITIAYVRVVPLKKQREDGPGQGNRRSRRERRVQPIVISHVARTEGAIVPRANNAGEDRKPS